MPATTVTVREVKNKDTGIDLSVSGYKETKAMIGATYAYHIMVVTKLHHFKLPKHKDSDNVQFMVPKKFSDFEELWTKMNMKYSGTAFPPIPKKVLMVTEAVAKERWSGLDYYLKFLAMTPTLCTSVLLLNFLGVNPVRSGKLAGMQVSESIVSQHEPRDDTSAERTPDIARHTLDTEQPGNLFDDDDEADEMDNDLFTSDTSAALGTHEETKLFDSPDLGGAIGAKEGAGLIIQEALPAKAASPGPVTDDDSDDLFQIDDNLDRIMDLKLKSNGDNFEATIHEKSTETDESTSPVRPKPAMRSKPSNERQSSNKADQSLTTFENISIAFDTTPSKTDILSATSSNRVQSETGKQRPVPAPRQKPPIKGKPAVSRKPDILPKPPKPAERVKEATDDLISIGQDDILKYIQDNTADDDVDLFS